MLYMCIAIEFGVILNGVVLSVVDDVPVDSETPMVTSSIFPGFAGPVFEDAYRGKVCVRVFIGMSARVL